MPNFEKRGGYDEWNRRDQRNQRDRHARQIVGRFMIYKL